MSRYYFIASIGDGGEMHASAEPEDICNGDEQELHGHHTFSAWVYASDTAWALINGTAKAQTYFNALCDQERKRRMASLEGW